MSLKPLLYQGAPLQGSARKRLTQPPSIAFSRVLVRTPSSIRNRTTHTEFHQNTASTASSAQFFSDPSPQPPPESDPRNISDHEWNLRAGRAVYTLRTTLPTFFETGLVSIVDPSPSSSSSRLGIHETRNERSRSKSKPGSESIYAPNIRLCYTPPAALSLPSPFPKKLQVEGLPLYHASATFIRHTLSAFNTDLHIEMHKLHVRSEGSRNREITIRIGVSGKSRISGARNEWDVHSTYMLSPHTALVDLHIVESIHPAPHITFYDGLRAALARLAGVDVGRETGSGVRGCVPNQRMDPIPICGEVKRTGKE